MPSFDLCFCSTIDLFTETNDVKHPKLAASFQEGAETETQTAGTPTGKGKT